MARQPDVQYIQLKADDNAISKVDKRIFCKDAAPVSTRRNACKAIAVDPVAICGIVFAAVMLFAMAFGLLQYKQCLQESQQMSQYVSRLRLENAQLQQTYHDGYDIEEIREIALDAGMIPAEKVEQVVLDVPAPQQEQLQMSFWESVTNFLAGFFA